MRRRRVKSWKRVLVAILSLAIIAGNLSSQVVVVKAAEMGELDNVEEVLNEQEAVQVEETAEEAGSGETELVEESSQEAGSEDEDYTLGMVEGETAETPAENTEEAAPEEEETAPAEETAGGEEAVEAGETAEEAVENPEEEPVQEICTVKYLFVDNTDVENPNEIKTFENGAAIVFPEEADKTWKWETRDENGEHDEFVEDTYVVVKDLVLFAVIEDEAAKEEAAEEKTEEGAEEAAEEQDTYVEPAISVSIVDEKGEAIEGAKNEMPAFLGTLTLNEPEKAPVKVDGYTYVKATIEDTVVDSLIKKVHESKKADDAEKAEEAEAEETEERAYEWFYVAGGEEVAIEEDTQIVFAYEESNVAVEVKATAVDQFGDVIAEKYTDMELTAFDADGVMVLNDTENPPVDKVSVRRGLFKVISYEYVKATINNEIISSLKQEAAKDGEGYCYSYSVDDGDTWNKIKEDTTVYFEYTDGQKTVFTYEDAKVKVTATLQHAGAIPDDADLKVTPITSGPLYDAYMEALNKNAKMIDPESEAGAYNEENTLLYDIAFIADKVDEEGNIIEGEKMEVEPAEGMVNISMEFKKAQLSDELNVEEADDVTVIHMPLTESAKASADTTLEASVSAGDIQLEVMDASVSVAGEKVDFVSDSFSVICITNKNGNGATPIPGEDIDYGEILGLAKYYGVVTNSFNSNQHMDSNLATGYFTGTNDFTPGTYNNAQNGGEVIVASMSDTAKIQITGGSNTILHIGEHCDVNRIELKQGSSHVVENEAALKADVKSMIDTAAANMAAKWSGTKEHVISWVLGPWGWYPVTEDNTNKITGVDDGNWNEPELDLTKYDAGTYYLEIPDGMLSQKLKLGLRSDQKVVLKYDASGDVDIKQLLVKRFVGDGYTSVGNNAAGEAIAKSVFYYLPNATGTVTVDNVVGTVIAPKASVNFGNSGGWLVCDRVESHFAEWHFMFQGMPTLTKTPAEVQFGVTKILQNKTVKDNPENIFTLYETGPSLRHNKYDSNHNTGKNPANETIPRVVGSVTVNSYNGNVGSKLFEPITYSKEGAYYYVIQENEGAAKDGWQATDGYWRYAKVTVSKEVSGSGWNYHVSYKVTKVEVSKEINRAQYSNDATLKSPDTVNANGYTFEFTNKRNVEPTQYTFTATKEFDGEWPDGFTATLRLVAIDNDDPEHNYGPNYISGVWMPDGATTGTVTYPDGTSRTATYIDVTVSKDSPVADFGTVVFPYDVPEGQGSVPYAEGDGGDPNRVPDGRYRCYMYKMYEVLPSGKMVDSSYTVQLPETDRYGNQQQYSVTHNVIEGVDYDGTIQRVKLWINQLTDTQGNYRVVVTPEGSKGGTYCGGDLKEVKFVNKYDAAGEYTLQAAKHLTGRKFKQGDEWTFTVTGTADDGSAAPMPENNPVTIHPTAADENDVTISFGKIAFTKAHAGKTFTYKIKETGNVPHVTNDIDDEKTVTITVGDNRNGTLSIVSSVAEGGVTFTNAYTAEGHYPLQATKRLAGRQFQKDDVWTFTVTGSSSDGSAVPMPTRTTVQTTATSGNEQSIDFGTIDFTQAHAGKDYTYVITESGNVDPVQNDKKNTRTVKIEVRDVDGNGTLTLNPQIVDDTNLVFTNTYNVSANYTINVSKHLSGREFSGNDHWTFTLTGSSSDGSAVPMPSATEYTTAAESGNDEDFAFGPIHFTELNAGKSYTYTITESGKVASVDNDTTASKTVTLTVTDDGKGNLTVSDDLGTNKVIKFTNTYHADGSYPLTGSKTLAGREFKAGDQWTFTVTGSSNDGSTVPMPANPIVRTSATSGNYEVLNFGTISFTEANVGKTYTYTVTESGSAESVDNDKNLSRTVQITVSDNGNGSLNIQDEMISDVKNFDFTNTYTASGEHTLLASKKLTGRSFKENDHWTFTLTGKADDPTDTAIVPMPENTTYTTSAVTGNEEFFSFGPILFDQTHAGKSYTYTITESGTVGAVDNDTQTTRTVKLTVSDNKKGQLTISDNLGENKVMTFTNEYKATGEYTLNASKHMSGRQFQTGDHWLFTLTGKADDPTDEEPVPMPSVTEYTTQATSGTDEGFSFGPIKFTQKNVGKSYTYTITESDIGDGVASVAIDPVPSRSVTVTVGDNSDGTLYFTDTLTGNKVITFTNTYTANGSYPLAVKKTLDGRQFQEGDVWTFTVEGACNDASITVPMPTNAVLTTDATSGYEDIIDFGNINFTQAHVGKEFTYTITESGNVVPVKNDTVPVRKVKVTVDDNGNGTLDVKGTVIAGDNLEYVNKYEVDTTYTIKVRKHLTGREFQEGDEWIFRIAGTTPDGNGTAPMPSVTEYTTQNTSGNDEDFSFGPIKFDQTNAGKSYVYTITEEGDVQSVKNDETSIRTVTVTVTDDGKGHLTVSDDLEESKVVTFTNIYEASGKYRLDASKTMDGRQFQTGDAWTFTVTASSEDDAQENIPMPEVTSYTTTETSGYTESFSFGEIAFTEANVGKTYTYTVTEEGTAESVRNAASRSVTLTVCDNGKGTLYFKDEKGTVITGSNFAFTNEYSASGSHTINVRKHLVGRPFQAGDNWTFTISGAAVDPEDTAVVPMPASTTYTTRATSGEYDTFSFGPISFDQTHAGKSYIYTIVEDGTVEPVKNDETKSRTVTLSVSDDGQGHLTITDDLAEADETDDTNVSYVTFTNTYEAVGEYPLSASKTMVGRPFQEGDAWTFTVTGSSDDDDNVPMPTNPIVTTTATSGYTDDGIDFGKITFTEANVGKTYTYTVEETGDDQNVSLAASQSVTFTVLDNGDGTLRFEDAEGNALEESTFGFTNTYTATGEYTLSALKAMEGRQFQAGDVWTFTVTGSSDDDDIVPMPENPVVTTNAASGYSTELNFGKITFTEGNVGKTYVYTIEESGSATRVANDPVTKRVVSVTVGDNGDGTLNFTDSLDEGEVVTFTNTYTADGSYPLAASKHLTGREFQKGDAWTFTVTATASEGTAPMPDGATELTTTKTSGNDETFEFGYVHFTQAHAGKTFTYTITETGTADSVDNDTASSRTVELKVEDNGDGTLNITDNMIKGTDFAFTNVYKASGSYPISVSKHLAGREFQEGDAWTFTLEGSEGAPMPAKTEVTTSATSGNDDNDISFGSIAFTQAHAGKTYTYTVKENGSALSVTNDENAERTITFTVVDDGHGHLSFKDVNDAVVTGSNFAFTNIYKATGSYPLTASKHLTGREFQEGDEWTFKVAGSTLDGGDVPMPDKTTRYTTSAKEGTVEAIDFGEIHFTEANAGKTYKYTVTETGEIQSVANDTAASRTIELKVEDNGDGTLKITDTMVEGTNFEFTNTYTASGSYPISVSKHLTGREFKDGDVWTFTLTGSENAPMPAKTEVTTSATSGNDDKDISFGSINFSQGDVGKTYTYTVTETGTITAVTNDPAPSRSVSITVYDNGDGTLYFKDAAGEVVTGSNFAYTNTYDASGDIVLQGTKYIENRSFGANDAWRFTITANTANSPLPTVNYVDIEPREGKSADFAFGEIHFTLADVGTHVYTVTETGDVSGVTNDAPCTVTLVVSDNKDGTLDIKDSYSGDGKLFGLIKPNKITFTNVYAANGRYTLKASKHLAGRAFAKGDEWTFTLTGTSDDGSDVPMPKKGLFENTSETIKPTAGYDEEFEFGTISFSEKHIGKTFTYTIVESGTVDGVTNDPNTSRSVVITVNDGGDGSLVLDTSITGGDSLTFTNIYEETAVSVKKNWVDAWNGKDNYEGFRPASIEVQLYANGVAVAEEAGGKAALNETNNWSYTWNNLQKNTSGEMIVYTVDEVSVPNGYIKGDAIVKDTASDGTVSFTITNTHEVKPVSLRVNKVWNDDDNMDHNRPLTLKVQLWKQVGDSKEQVDSATLSFADGWSHEFKNLKKFENGKEITYFVVEEAIENYVQNEAATTTVVADDYITVTLVNDYKIDKTQKTVIKAWDDEDDKDGMRPQSIVVQLYYDEDMTEECGPMVMLNAANDWTKTWLNLPVKYNGKEAHYTVKEVTTVLGYEKPVYSDGATVVITNKHTPQTTSVEGVKTWNDANNADGLRPESIEIQLYADGELVDQKTVTAADGWKWSFTDLPKYRAGKVGELVEYTISEVITAGTIAADVYEIKVDGYNVINTYIPILIDIEGTKTWVDNNNAAGVRPGSIRVNLLADGLVVDTLTVTADTNWTYAFKGLHKYVNGREVLYTVTEDAIDDYVTSITGYDITNTYTPGYTSITGNKVWNDEGNVDGIRPGSITVRLYRDGEQIATTRVTAADNWVFVFKDLLVKGPDGHRYIYTVTEDGVDGYTTAINGFTIVNTHIPTPPPVNPPMTPPVTPPEENTPTPPGTPELPGGPDDNGVLGARRTNVLGARRQKAVLGARRAPQTGDESKMAAWAMAMSASAAACAAWFGFRKKSTKK